MNTRTTLDEKLELIREDLSRMSALVEENISRASAAMKSRDQELVKLVKTADKNIDILQLKIEDETAKLIATESPVARDLREMVCIFKLASNIERAGDYAVHLAKATAKLKDRPALRSMEHMEIMANTGCRMIRGAMLAYRNHDAKAARSVAALDDIIDKEHKALTEETLNFMKKHPDLIKKTARILTVSNFLERLGDHITNICEAILYMVENKHEELN